MRVLKWQGGRGEREASLLGCHIDLPLDTWHLNAAKKIRSVLQFWSIENSKGSFTVNPPLSHTALFHTTARCVGMCICGVCVCVRVCVLMLMCVKSMQISLTNKKNRGKNTPIEWPSVLVCLTRVGGKDGGQAAGLLPILRHPAVPERHRYDSFPRRIYEYKCSIEKPRASFILSYNMNMAFPYHPSLPPLLSYPLPPFLGSNLESCLPVGG